MALNLLQNPEIYRQALAMQGKDTSFLDQQAEQPAPQPAQPQLPPETNQALEAVGSEYRVPAPVQAPAPAAPVETAPAPEPSREVADFNPNAGNKRGQFVDGQNRQMDLKQEQGDILSEGESRKASLAGELEDKRRAGLERADTRHDAALARKDQNTAKAYEALDSMTRKIKNPPDNTTGKVLGIIGSIISMGGGGKAVGSGLQMLGQALSTDLQEWAQGISGDDTIRKSLMEMNAAEDQGQESELTQEAKLSALAAGVYSAAIDKVVAETNSKEAKRAGEELKLGLRQQYLSHAMAVEGKAAAARQTTEIYRAIASQPTPEARAALAAQFGPAGEKALEAIQKGDKGAADINATAVNTAKTAAEIQKLRSEGGTGGTGSEVAGGLTVVNPERWNSVPSSVKADFMKAQGALPGLKATLTELRDLVRQYGTETLPTEAKRKMEALQAAAISGIKEANSLGALDKGVTDVIERQIGDATAWNFGLGNWVEGADKKLDATIQDIERNTNSRAAAFGLAHAAGSAPVATPGTYDPAFSPGKTSTPSAASVGITRDASGQIALPNAKVNLTPEQAAGIPEAFLRGR